MRRFLYFFILFCWMGVYHLSISYYVINNGKVYTASENAKTLPIEPVKVSYNCQSALFSTLFAEGENNIIEDIYYSGMKSQPFENTSNQKAHYEIINSMTSDEFKISLGIPPEKNDNFICRMYSVHGMLDITNEQLDEFGMINNTEVGNWHAKVCESFRMLRWQTFGIRYLREIEDIRKAEENIREKEENLSEREENLSEKKENLQVREENLSEKEENLREKDENLSEKKENLSEKKDDLQVQDENLSEREENLRDRED